MSHLSALFLLLTLSSARASSLLFVHDGSNVDVAYSIFIKHLTTLGFNIEYTQADHPDLQLLEYGQLKYDNVVLFAPNTDEFGGDVSASKLAEYVDRGGNLLIGLDSRVTDTVRSVVGEFGMESDTEDTAVIDHFNVAEMDQGEHTVIDVKTGQWTSAKPFNPKGKKAEKLNFQGVGLSLNENNKLVYPVLRASSTAYSWIPGKDVNTMPMMLGDDMTLVAAMEARNNARVLVSGSLRFFSDDFAGNNEFYARQLALWAFQRAGVLKIDNIKHYISRDKDGNKLTNQEALEVYTTRDWLGYSVDIYEKNEETGNWRAATNDDIKVEFRLVDYFIIRKELIKDSGPTFSTDIRLSDRIGVYKFIISYKSTGYTILYNEVLIPVRPLQHDQHERFIPEAFPYYAGAGSMLVGLFLFSFVFLYHKDK